MEIFKGPLGSFFNYLQYIALDNCLDYIRLAKGNKEEGRNKTPDKYKQLRYFLNAIESLNNLPEYFFHQYKKEENWSEKDLNTILGGIRQKHKVLRDIEQIANAYKHCIRRNQTHLHATDLQSPNLTATIGQDGVDVNYDFKSIEDEELMGEAFKFWIDYLNNPDKAVLIPLSSST